MTEPRRRFGLPPVTIHVESMDREDLVIAALTRCRDIETVHDLHAFDDDSTIRKIGWYMAGKTGTDFRIGRRLLQLLAPGGYLMPPPEFRLSRATEPTPKEIYEAPFVTPWSCQLWQSGNTPAEWRVNGSVYHAEWPLRLWSRLLYLNRPKSMAMTAEGWVKLGRRS